MVPCAMLPRGTLLLAALAASAPVAGEGGDTPRPAVARSLPVRFLANRGQWPEDVRFGMRGPTRTLLSQNGWTFCLERWRGTEPGSRERYGAVVRMTFLSANPLALQGEGLLPGRHHFLLGNAPEGWVRNVPGFQRLLYREMYPGIDLRVRGLPEGEVGAVFEYDLLLQPGADLERAVVQCDGVARLELDRGGSLMMHIEMGGCDVVLTHKPPVS